VAGSPLQHAQRLALAGNTAEAEQACRQALKVKPGDQQALRLLGRLTRQNGRAPESVQIFQQLGRARPNDIQLLGELGASLTEANMAAQALPLLRRAVDTIPKAAEWRVWLGRCQLRLFDTHAAVATLREAMALAPDDADAALQGANALLLASASAEAEACARRALALRPGWAQARLALASALDQQSRIDEEIGVLREVVASAPAGSATHVAALGSLAKCLRAQARYDEALALLEPLAGERPTPQMALVLAPVYSAQGRADEAAGLLGRALAAEPLPAPVRASLGFALGDALHRLKRYDEAFGAFKAANDAYPRVFSREHKARMYDDIMRAFDADAMRNGPRADPHTGLDASRCVFIVGMPRSGTTLVEQIIDAHPRAHGAGELTELEKAIGVACAASGGPGPACFGSLTAERLTAGGRHYLDAVTALAPGAERITDKMPHNFEMLGMIERMLPGARVIVCTRNAVDNCLSLYFTQLSAWHSYANDLSDLAWAYARHARLMDHWRRVCSLPMLEVRYEETVADTPAQARRIIEFVGLEWDDRCLRFYESDRQVTTASVEQVRRPIYTSSVARWRRYEPHLGPLLDGLREAGVWTDAD
jgi:tetratricopeptide (TPR) repeat protein